MNTWIISDTHFSHKSILSFKRSDGSPLRDFKHVDEMDQYMIDQWNSVVHPDDKVYHLGDVAMCNITKLTEIFSHLPGRKVLIKGNHDTLKLSQYAYLFSDVRAYHVLDGLLLAHIPVHPESLSRWKGQIHGHLHYNKVKDPRYFNVSVECINYTPINFEEIKKYYGTLPSTT